MKNIRGARLVVVGPSRMSARANIVCFVSQTSAEIRLLAHTFFVELNILGMVWTPSSMMISNPLQCKRRRTSGPH